MAADRNIVKRMKKVPSVLIFNRHDPHSPKTDVNALMSRASTPPTYLPRLRGRLGGGKDVDGRDKPGHDEEVQSSSGAVAVSCQLEFNSGLRKAYADLIDNL